MMANRRNFQKRISDDKKSLQDGTTVQKKRKNSSLTISQLAEHYRQRRESLVGNHSQSLFRDQPCLRKETQMVNLSAINGEIARNIEKNGNKATQKYKLPPISSPKCETKKRKHSTILRKESKHSPLTAVERGMEGTVLCIQTLKGNSNNDDFVTTNAERRQKLSDEALTSNNTSDNKDVNHTFMPLSNLPLINIVEHEGLTNIITAPKELKKMSRSDYAKKMMAKKKMSWRARREHAHLFNIDLIDLDPRRAMLTSSATVRGLKKMNAREVVIYRFRLSNYNVVDIQYSG